MPRTLLHRAFAFRPHSHARAPQPVGASPLATKALDRPATCSAGHSPGSCLAHIDLITSVAALCLLSHSIFASPTPAPQLQYSTPPSAALSESVLHVSSPRPQTSTVPGPFRRYIDTSVLSHHAQVYTTLSTGLLETATSAAAPVRQLLLADRSKVPEAGALTSRLYKACRSRTKSFMMTDCC